MTEFRMFCGAPASGKSTLAEKFVDFGYCVVSSDAIREELYGDSSVQQDHAKVFSIARQRAIDALKYGRPVVFDATNMKYKDRMVTMNEINKLSGVYKICTIFAEPLEVLLDRNFARERIVPEAVIRRMIENFEMPTKAEGFDEILLINEHKISCKEDISRACGFNQENPNHSKDLLDHCMSTQRYLKFTHSNEDNCLYLAAALHDFGKLETKTFFNTKGIEDDRAHYYNHENVGAYKILLYDEYWNKKDRIHIAQLVCYHMIPYRLVKAKENTEERWRNRIGSELYDEVLLIHEADRAAH